MAVLHGTKVGNEEPLYSMVYCKIWTRDTLPHLQVLQHSTELLVFCFDLNVYSVIALVGVSPPVTLSRCNAVERDKPEQLSAGA